MYQCSLIDDGVEVGVVIPHTNWSHFRAQVETWLREEKQRHIVFAVMKPEVGVNRKVTWLARKPFKNSPHEIF